MSQFDINYGALLKQLLPHTLRKVSQFRWLRILISPVVYLYNKFINYRTSTLYDLAHTSQVTCMQTTLNDTFDPTLRRIVISDDISHDPIYIKTNAENSPVYIKTNTENVPRYLYTDIEGKGGYYDFIVQVPTGLTFNTARMKALINKYRLPSMCNYLIKTV